MKHKNIEILIQKSLDFEINQDEAHMLQDHIARCPECRMMYETMVDLQHSLGMLVEYYPHVGFNDRILHALGTARRVLWKKAALIFSGAWVASLISLFFLPYQSLLSKLLTSTPALVRLVDTTRTIITTIGHTLSPLSRIPLQTSSIAIGVLVSITAFYLIGRAIQKEEKCKA